MGDQLEYDRRANANRPTDPAAIAAEVVRLNATGLKIRDISDALKIPANEVARILVRAALNPIGEAK
jgi:hypothetical protein